MLADYESGMFYEHTLDYKKAAKAYQNAYLMDEIGDLTKDMMLSKADLLKGAAKKASKEVIEEVPVAAEPEVTPTETPTEEKKP